MRAKTLIVAGLLLVAGCSPAADEASVAPSPSPRPGRPVSMAEARATVPYRLPRVGSRGLTGELAGVYLRRGDAEIHEAEGPAVVFQWPNDLTLTIDPTLEGYDPRHYPMSHGVIVVPEVKGDPKGEPRWALRTVRGRTAVALDPTEDHYGMLSWSEEGIFFTFQSPDHSKEELIEIAETITFGAA
jgi:hypothetical protein